MNRIQWLVILVGLLLPSTNAIGVVVVPTDLAARNFGSITPYSTHVGSNDVIMTDFNVDGIPDVATANEWGNTVTVLYGLPAGGFGNRTDIFTGIRCRYLSSADFDKNGSPDIVVSNASDNNISVLLQQPGGTFTKTNYPVGDFPNGVVAADLNQDGRADIATAINANSITVRYNDGNGGFGARADIPIDSVGRDIYTVDLNHDSIADLFTTLPTTGSMFNLLTGLPGGGFATRTPFTFATPRPTFSTVVDLNQDNVLDLAYSTGTGIAVALGLPLGGFQLKGQYLEPINPAGIASADFNLDGIRDIAVSDQTDLWIYYGLGGGDFAAGQTRHVGDLLHRITIGDVNSDGRPDILAAAGVMTSGEVYVFLNTIPEPGASVLALAAAVVFSIGSRRRV